MSHFCRTHQGYQLALSGFSCQDDRLERSLALQQQTSEVLQGGLGDQLGLENVYDLSRLLPWGQGRKAPELVELLAVGRTLVVFNTWRAFLSGVQEGSNARGAGASGVEELLNAGDIKQAVDMVSGMEEGGGKEEEGGEKLYPAMWGLVAGRGDRRLEVVE